MRQAKSDFDHAKKILQLESFDWVCLVSQQASKIGVKALYQSIGEDTRRYSIAKLLRDLPEEFEISEELIEYALVLDRHYIPTRYPNGIIEGAPVDAFSKRDAKEAIDYAEKIIEFCENSLSRTKGEGN